MLTKAWHGLVVGGFVTAIFCTLDAAFASDGRPIPLAYMMAAFGGSVVAEIFWERS